MFIKNSLYRSDLEQAMRAVPSFEQFRGKSFLITGASGLIASFLIDLLMYVNEQYNMGIQVYALGRNIDRLCRRFESHSDKTGLCYIIQDIRESIRLDCKVDYIVHAAGNGYPAAFQENPVETMTAVLLGTNHIMEYVRDSKSGKVLYISSGEVYGQIQEQLPIRETESGYVDCTSVRSCYPNAKRAAESLVSSYGAQYDISAVIVRPGHTYGPNTTSNDNRANVQFMNAAVHGKDVVLHSSGRQIRSYTYVADNVSALLTILLHGDSGVAYNVANRDARGTIADFASKTADCAGVHCIFEEAEERSALQKTPITYAVLDSTRLECLGWKGSFSMQRGIDHTYRILKEIMK